MSRIYYTKPSITDLEVQYATDAARNGWGEHCYDYIHKFENKFRDFLGCKFALSTSSCTGALHLALAALDLMPGDEVIVPDITWAASVVPITYLGGKPVFVDVLSDSWCIDPGKIEEAITNRTKGIIAVHLYGNLAEMDEIKTIAGKNGLWIIEDAAEALGSEYKGTKAGNMGDIGVFSFHGTKTITTGEGGMIVTNDPSLYEKVRILWDHGRNPKTNKMFWVEEIGFKYKLSNIQAAIGCAQLERADGLISRKREQFQKYFSAFKDIEGLTMNPEPSYTKNSYWMPTLIFDRSLGVDRDQFIESMRAENIDIRNFFYPVSMFPMFDSQLKNLVAYDIYNRGINLPAYYDLSYDEIDFIIKNILDRLNGIK